MPKWVQTGGILFPSRIPKSIGALLIAMMAGYLFKEIFPGPAISLFALIPAEVTRRFWIWQIATYLFLHGSLIHLLFNGLSLYWFGPPLIERWGEKEFLKFFVICGLGAGVISGAVQHASPIPIVGCSGAIFGLLYAWAREYPDAVIYVYGIFPMRARHLVILLFVVELLLSYTPSPIARFAHLGGLLTGWIYLRSGDWKERIQAQWLRRERAYREIPPRPEDDIDRILEKISREGIGSLTAIERNRLDQAGRRGERRH